jgi:hypothetical protein
MARDGGAELRLDCRHRAAARGPRDGRIAHHNVVIDDERLGACDPDGTEATQQSDEIADFHIELLHPM